MNISSKYPHLVLLTAEEIDPYTRQFILPVSSWLIYGKNLKVLTSCSLTELFPQHIIFTAQTRLCICPCPNYSIYGITGRINKLAHLIESKCFDWVA